MAFTDFRCNIFYGCFIFPVGFAMVVWMHLKLETDPWSSEVMSAYSGANKIHGQCWPRTQAFWEMLCTLLIQEKVTFWFPQNFSHEIEFSFYKWCIQLSSRQGFQVTVIPSSIKSLQMKTAVIIFWNILTWCLSHSKTTSAHSLLMSFRHCHQTFYMNEVYSKEAWANSMIKMSVVFKWHNKQAYILVYPTRDI